MSPPYQDSDSQSVGAVPSGGSRTATAASPHAVLLPFPVQGHINPMVQLAKALARHGVRVTVVHNRQTHALLTTHQPSTRTPLIQHTWIDNGLAADLDYSNLLNYVKELEMSICAMREPFRELLLSLAEDHSTRATCVVFGSFCPWAHTVACELGIPSAFFWTQSASVLDIYYHYPLLESRGFFPYGQFTSATGNGTSTQNTYMVDYVPGIPPLHPGDIPSLLHVADTSAKLFQSIKEQMDFISTCKYVLLNTFYELESESCDVLYHALSKDSLHFIGPLLPLALLGGEDAKDTSVGANLFEETNECIKWLDNQKHGSVLYVSFGSIFQPTPEDYETIALGAKASKQPFLWVIKPTPSIHNPFDILPLNFEEDTKHFGLIIPWAPQLEVLSHPSVGAFLSHCGWNSALESISMGVPILPFPFFSDQKLNSRYIADVWKVGMNFEKGENEKTSSEEVARVITMVLCEEEGEELKKSMARFKENARKATQRGGSSYSDIQKFVEALKSTS